MNVGYGFSSIKTSTGYYRKILEVKRIIEKIKIECRKIVMFRIWNRYGFQTRSGWCIFVDREQRLMWLPDKETAKNVASRQGDSKECDTKKRRARRVEIEIYIGTF